MTPKEFELALVEAAEEFGTLRYDPNTCPTGNMMAKNIACKVGFRQGARWQRNHVWHKNTEFPSRGIRGSGWGEQCLVKIKDEHQNIPIVAQANMANGYFYFCDNRGVWITMSNVDCWAYLDDLTPTSFDDIIEENKDVLQRLKHK